MQNRTALFSKTIEITGGSDITADSSNHTIKDIILSDPVLKLVQPKDLARMLLRVKRRSVSKGENLFEENHTADSVYLIEKGQFAISQAASQSDTKDSGYLGEEAVLGSVIYRKTATAREDGCVISLPAHDLRRIIADNDNFKNKFFESYTGHKIYYEDFSAASKDEKDTFSVIKTVGWLSSFICPLLVYWLISGQGISQNTTTFLAIISIAVTMWVFQLVPDFVPPLFGVLMVILLDIAPAELALSGFTSGTFFMCLSVFVIGALMVSSGLIYRIMLHILRLFPKNRTWYSRSLLFIGALLTPVVPSPVGRMAMIMPLLFDLLETSEKKSEDNLVATQFVNSTINGVILLSTIFLTGKPANLILFGLFDDHTQFTYQWLNWLLASSCAAAILLVSYFVLSGFFFRKAGSFSISRSVIEQQIKIIGPVTLIEWSAIISVLILGIGILTTAIHKIEIPWMTLTIIMGLLLFGTVGGIEIRSRIDWTLMIFIASIISWVSIMKATGIDKLIVNNLEWLGVYMKTQPMLFIAMLTLSVIVVRLALPLGITVVMFATAMFPVAADAGISPWLIGFIILLMSEAHIFPYQNSFALQLKNEMAYRGLEHIYSEKQLVMFNILMIVIRMGAIYASVPFWRFLQIL
ncbi:MAG: cyclic nucleotide-binding domain-containing protein [Desulfobacteraceae bacterium]|nr:cyclic nucleotide-binding domain-containing protein [Desulfobacteraceae bacterium]